jgi:hypothetical protein
MNRISCSDDSPNCKCEQRTDGRDEIDLPSSNSVNKERHGDIHDQSLCLESPVDAELGLRARDANVIHDLIQIIRNESIAGPLREETNSCDYANSLAVALGAEEVEPGVCFSFFLNRESSADFGVLKLHELILVVAIGMVVG